MILTAAHLLAGAAALVIPLIIHLLNRSRHRKVRWGAMHLLQRVVRTNQRRLRIQQLILLALRCAFPAILTVALAGPVLTEFNFLPGDAPGRTVILVDNSYSLRTEISRNALASGSGDDQEPRANARRLIYADSSNTAFKSVARALDEVLETQADATEIALVSIGGHPTLIEPAVLDRRRIRQQFEANVHPDADPANIPAAFQMAREILEQSSRPRRTTIVISDFQDADWKQFREPRSWIRENSAGEASDSTTELSRVQLLKSGNTAIAFYRVGQQHAGNVAVENIRLPPIALAVGQQIEITATVRNFGPALSETPVFLRVNGDRVAATQVDLPSGGTAEVSFQRAFDDRGSHLVQIEVDVVDPLPFDNRQAAAIEVPERLPVLVVDSAADAEVNFLKAALAPFELDGIGIEDLIRATFVTPEEFAPVQLFGNRAVILTNVTRLTEPQLLALDKFVRNGGGLVLFPGPNTNLTWFNEELFPSLAPTVSWQQIIPAPDQPTKILRERSDHPVFEIFNQTDNGDPATASIQSWLSLGSGFRTDQPERVSVRFGEKPGANALRLMNSKTQTLSRFASHPFIVESTHHRGRVLISSTDAANEWSDMANQAFFVPLVQRLVVYAATNTVPPRNVTVGQPLVALLHPKTAGETLEFTDAAGHTHTVTAQTEGGVAKAVFPSATRPGPWTLANPHGSGPIRFAVQSNRAESDLKLLSKAELGTMAGDLGATLVQSRTDLESFERASRFGTEIWRPFLILALFLLFADVFLAQRFVRARSSWTRESSAESSNAV